MAQLLCVRFSSRSSLFLSNCLKSQNFRPLKTSCLKLSAENGTKKKSGEFGRLLGLAKPDKKRIGGKYRYLQGICDFLLMFCFERQE